MRRTVPKIFRHAAPNLGVPYQKYSASLTQEFRDEVQEPLVSRVMAGKTREIVVIGAGIIGLSSALRLQAADPSLTITIIAERFSPETTSDGAGGLWSLSSLCDTPIELRKRWGKATYDYLYGILKSEHAVKLGVSQCSGYILSDQTVNDDQWPYEDIVTRHKLSSQDLKNLNLPLEACIMDGFFLTDLFLVSTLFMQTKIKEFQQKGGRIIKRRVRSFNEFMGKFDVVVNCSGLGALELCKDEMMQGIRGQIMKIKAPWLKHFYQIFRHDKSSEGRTCYIFPRHYDVVIGGTYEKGRCDTGICEETNKYIIDVTSKYEPTIKNAEVITSWAGVRPFRAPIRLEKEVMKLATENGSVKTLQVVHNYGHGGGGLSVFWGCAGEAKDLALSFLK